MEAAAAIKSTPVRRRTKSSLAVFRPGAFITREYWGSYRDRPPEADFQLTDQLIDADSALSQPACLRKKFSITVAKKGGHSCIG